MDFIQNKIDIHECVSCLFIYIYITLHLGYIYITSITFGIEQGGHWGTPGENAGKQPGGLQHGNSHLKNTWGAQWGEYSVV